MVGIEGTMSTMNADEAKRIETRYDDWDKAVEVTGLRHRRVARQPRRDHTRRARATRSKRPSTTVMLFDSGRARPRPKRSNH